MICEYGLSLVTPPLEEPLLLSEVKHHCRVEQDFEDDDVYLESLLRAARTKIENNLGRQLVTATWRMTLDQFPDWEIRLPRTPLVNVTSIQYVDTAGVLQTLASSDYNVDANRTVGIVEPAYGKTWPATRRQAGSVRITFTAGYGTATLVPEPYKLAIKLLVGQWYENRQAAVEVQQFALPMGVESLLVSVWDGRYA